MSLGHHRPDQGSSPTDRTKIALACVCLAIPVIALMWVPSYTREDPELAGFPFFFWYQFLWVFLCAGLTWAAYRLTLSARPSARPGSRAPKDGER